MPKNNTMKKSQSKLRTENQDDEFVKEMKDRIEDDENKITPFKGVGGHCIELEEDDPEDLVLVTDFAKSSAPKKRKNFIENENVIDLAIKDLSDVKKRHRIERERARMTLQDGLGSVLSQMDSDGAALQKSNQQLQQIFHSQVKLALRTETAHNQRLQALREVNENYSKMCEKLETQQRDKENLKQEELAAKIKAMQQRLASDYRRKTAEAWKNAFSNF